MLNKIQILFWVSIINFISLNALGQMTKVSFELNELEINKNQLTFNLYIYNEGEQGFTLYKPYAGDICSGILKFYLINIKTNKRHEIFPCHEVDDLSAILLNEKNSIFLDVNEGFTKGFKFSLKEISPYIDKGKYLFYSEFNLKDVFFDTKNMNVLQEDLKSNKVEIDYQ